MHPENVHLIDHKAADPETEARRYEDLIRRKPIDLATLGIGISGHLALKEPGATDFDDSRWVHGVDIAEATKNQLMHDPSFKEQGYIPEKYISLTMPAIRAIPFTYTIEPVSEKPILTRLANTDRVTSTLPASILLEMESVLFVDRDSCPDEWLE